MQVKVEDEHVEALERLAKFNRRSPTAEANVAISDHLNGIWIQSDKSRLSEKRKKQQREQDKKKEH